MSRSPLPYQREISTGGRLLAAVWFLALVSPLSLALVWTLVWTLTPGLAQADVVLERREDRVDVTVENAPFTSYIFQGHAQPILFPIRVPGGETITRSWPMVPDVRERHMTTSTTNRSGFATARSTASISGRGSMPRASRRRALSR